MAQFMTRRLPIGVRAALVVTSAVLLAGGLSSCASQVAALAPVGGDALAGVRFASVDVLLAAKVGILEAPVCTQAGDAVSCTGTLTDGTAITVRADVGSTPHTMIVKVGDQVLYDGDVQSVLDEAARATK